MIIFLDGKFVDANKAKVSVFDHGYLYGDAVFERLRTYGGKIWNFRPHVDRLFNGAKLLRMHIPWTREQVEKWILQTVAKNKLPESSIRVQLTRGLGKKDLRYDFLFPRKPSLNIMVIPIYPWPAEFYKKGLPLTTFQGVRSFPEVKTTSLLVHIMALQEMADKGGKEAIFIDYRGHVMEGATSTVFFVKKGVLIVPKARVLAGTTAKGVIQIAKAAKIPVKKRIVSKRELSKMDECFITSVTRGVMPVCSIDGKKLEQKSPGKITQLLGKKFRGLTARPSPTLRG